MASGKHGEDVAPLFMIAALQVCYERMEMDSLNLARSRSLAAGKRPKPPGMTFSRAHV
jgi:hypothetical protein